VTDEDLRTDRIAISVSLVNIAGGENRQHNSWPIQPDIVNPPGLIEKFWTAQVETFMASAEREPLTGVWGQIPQRGPGEPLVRGSGGEAPLKLTAF